MRRLNLLVFIAVSLGAIRLPGQQPAPLKSRPAPAPVVHSEDPVDPPARTVIDARSHVRFDLPAGWNFSRRDGELSTFRFDARSAPRAAEVRVVANMAFNPYPRSTFSGALFYLSLTPRSTQVQCQDQAHAKPNQPLSSAPVGDVSFARGHDAHGGICTEARDTVYTAWRGGSCVRFDLVINSFCGGEVSGAQDLTDVQLANVEKRLEAILATVHFEGNEPEGPR